VCVYNYIYIYIYVCIYVYINVCIRMYMYRLTRDLDMYLRYVDFETDIIYMYVDICR